MLWWNVGCHSLTLRYGGYSELSSSHERSLKMEARGRREEVREDAATGDQSAVMRRDLTLHCWPWRWREGSRACGCTWLLGAGGEESGSPTELPEIDQLSNTLLFTQRDP